MGPGHKHENTSPGVDESPSSAVVVTSRSRPQTPATGACTQIPPISLTPQGRALLFPPTRRRKQVRELCGHTNRVSALSWNGAVLSSGSRDSTIANWDVRKRRDEACVARLTVHEQVRGGEGEGEGGPAAAAAACCRSSCTWRVKGVLSGCHTRDPTNGGSANPHGHPWVG